MVKEVLLRTKEMFLNNDKADVDYPLWQSIAEYMDGEKALVIKNESEGKYLFLGLVNEKKNKELCYMMEQDSMAGIFINNREGFDEAWDREEYEREVSVYLEEKFLEFQVVNIKAGGIDA